MGGLFSTILLECFESGIKEIVAKKEYGSKELLTIESNARNELAIEKMTVEKTITFKGFDLERSARVLAEEIIDKPLTAYMPDAIRQQVMEYEKNSSLFSEQKFLATLEVTYKHGEPTHYHIKEMFVT